MDHASQLIQERSAPPATLVIFGASGDLTRRKLLPAIESLARHERLPDQFAVVGVARTSMTDEQFADSALGERSLASKRQLQGGVRYIAGGYDDPETYKRLVETLDELDAQRGTSGNRLFYLSTPAGAFEPVINGLAGAGLNQPREGSFSRLVIEKPYGHDLRTRPRARRRRAHRVRRAPGLPHRSLPGQGHRPERAGAALRQLDLPADLESLLGRPRADHRRRDPRRRHPRRLLRARRRDARHRAEPRAPGPRAGTDGATGLVRGRGGAQREGEAAAGDPAAHRPGHRRRSRSADSTPGAAPARS